MEANQAGAHEALMLDVNGFVAETSSANIFIVSGGTLATPRRDMIMPGLTRGVVLGLATSERLNPVDGGFVMDGMAKRIAIGSNTRRQAKPSGRPIARAASP